MYLEGYKAGKVLPLVSNDHDVAEKGHLFFDSILNKDRGNVHTTSCDNQLYIMVRGRQ